MLSFLNPWLLWALPLAGAPILLHLLYLRRARRLPFGDLTLLRSAHARSLPSTRLRSWLILLLRCLALAGLIAALARPLFHSEAATGGTEQGLDLVVLADVSWSMGALERGKPRLEAAAAAGRQALEALKPGDRAAVAAFSEGLRVPLEWARGPAAAAETLARLKAGWRGTDAAAGLTAAYAFLSAERSGRKRAILLLSDNARHAFSRLPAEGLRGLPGYDPEVALLALDWGEAPANAGILDARAARGPGGREEAPELKARTVLHGPPRAGWGLDLIVQERRVDQRTVALKPGPPQSFDFRLPPAASAERWGRLELRRDALAADDVYYYSLRLAPPPKVLLLYGGQDYLEAGRAGYFLRKLLGQGSSLPYRLDVADFGRAGQVRLEDYGAVLIDDFRTLPPALSGALTRYVLRGGGLWAFAGTQADRGTFAALRELLPGELEEAAPSGGASSLIPGEDLSEPGAPRFAWEDFELREVRIGRRYGLKPGTGARVWFRDSEGRPLAAAGEFGRGRVLLWASSLDVRWTNLALKPVFAALADVGLRHLTRYEGRESWRSLRVGEPISRAWAPGERAPSKVVVRGPGGRRTTLIVSDRRVEYSDTREPGIYVLQPLGGVEDGAEAEVYAVNADRGGAEGDLTPAKGLPWIPLGLDTAREDFLRGVYGREAQGAVLAAVLLAFWLESLLSRPRRAEARRERRAGAAEARA